MAGNGLLSHVPHLVRRFFGSLSRRPPAAEDERWAGSLLLPGEAELWRRMAAADRRHAVSVARRVGQELGDTATRPVLAAALLHDVGKVEAGLGTLGRVGATLTGASPFRRRATGRLRAYLHHPEIGAAMLDAAGSDPVTVAWAREHHLPPDRWTVPTPIASVLKSADDD